ncbi:MAG: KamA family radical SAM protein [Elusimicrobia bacterium]|nr:KamA family radical SAM protein [Elusimicrobiota bacterium]
MNPLPKEDRSAPESGSSQPQSQSLRSSSGVSPITQEQWNDWQWHVRNRITTATELERWVHLTVEEKRAIHFSQGKYYFSVTPYWASLMDPTDFLCPIRRQAVPLDEEFRTSVREPYDFNTDGSRVANGRLIHLYSDRAIFSLHSHCAVYCRFCPQRRMQEEKNSLEKNVSFHPHETAQVTELEWEQILRYLEQRPQIQEVIVGGGEPLLLNDETLRNTLSRLRSVPSVKTLRVESRIVSVLPQRVTGSLIRLLKEFQPLYLVLHVNHAREISPEFSGACARLVDSGIPLASQTVLLREINDKTQTLSELFLALFKLRVRPYRLVQSLPWQGAEHFRTTISAGLRVIENLRGKMTGLSLPEYVVDTAGGKIPLRYETILSRSKKRLLLKNYEGKVFVYPEKIFTFSS